MKSQKDKNYKRRDFLRLAAGIGAFGLLHPAAFGQKKNDKMEDWLVYIGTYTSGKSRSEGIYVYKMNPSSGELKPYLTVAGVAEPSFLALDAKRKYLYAVNETVDYEGQPSGAVSAFAIDEKTGNLRFLNRQPSRGGAPCHLSVSNDGRYVLVANYVGGNVAVLPVEKDGRLGAALDVEQHRGTGPNKERQEAAHAHSVILDRANRFAFVNDLGIDRLMIYRFDAKTGKLEANDAQPFYQTKPGAGPRHFKFHPNGKLAFIINELDSTVTSLAYDDKRGALGEIQTVTTLPAGFAGANTTADVHVSPDGRYLYGSNRGHDSLAVFGIDEKSGKLAAVGHVSTEGKTPRNFALDPTGRFLLAANQNSDSIVVFRRDQATGQLQPTGFKAQAPAPVCLQIVAN